MQNFKNPIFQKRHYEFIADILKEIGKFEKMLDDNNSENVFYGKDVIKIFADKLAKSNPLFDKQKFLDRIGIK